MSQCTFDCHDVNIVKYFLDTKKVNTDTITIMIISEAFPKNPEDYFDGKGSPSFIENTNFLFSKNGCSFTTYSDYLHKGIYLTTALKCMKKDYLVSAKTIENCSHHLEKELDLFKNLKVILLMGDFAIKSVNYIWKRKYNTKIIPAGSTYKIRSEEFICNGIRLIPSYTQTGDSFGLEKSKVEMMTEDIGKALTYSNGGLLR